MNEKPRVMDLVRDSKNFVWDQQDYLIAYLKPILPAMIACDVLAQVGGQHVFAPLALLGLSTFYFLACFILACHRAVLTGASFDHTVHPFALKPGEGRFILLFFALTLLPGIGIFLGVFPIGLISGIVGGAVSVVLIIITVFLAMYFMIYCLRLFFMLPARSVNVKLSFKEATQISKGLLMKWMGAGFVLSLILGVPFIIFVFVMSVAVVMLFGAPDENITSALAVYITVGLPNLALTLLAAALNVVILSRLYQWAVEHQGVSEKE